MKINWKSRGLFFWLIVYSIAYGIVYLTLAGIFRRQGLSFVGGADPMGQSFPVFVQQWRWITGRESFSAFDFTLGIGEDRGAVLYCFGLFNPLHYLSVFFSEERLIEAYRLVLSVKLYLGGLSFAYFVYRRRGAGEGMIFGGLLYVFSNYLLEYGLYFFCFYDWCFTLPLLLVGVDELLERKERVLKISLPIMIGVVWQALNGFYFLYMELLVAAAYTLLRLLLSLPEKKKIPIKNLVSLLGQVLLGLLLSAPVLLPGIRLFLGGNRNEGASVYRLSDFLPSVGGMLSYATKLVTENCETVLFFPLLLLPALVFLLLRFRQNWKILLLLGLSIIAANIPFVGSMLNGFSYSTDRGLVFTLFAFCYAGVAGWDAWKAAIQSYPENRRTYLLGTGLSTLYFLGLIGIAGDGEKRAYAVFMLLFFVVFQGIVTFTRAKKVVRYVFVGSLVLLEVLHVNMLYGQTDWFGGLSRAASGYVPVETMEEYLDAGVRQEFLEEQENVKNGVQIDAQAGEKTGAQTGEEKSAQAGKVFSRMDLTKISGINDGVLFGYAGTREYFSIINENYMNFVKTVGVQTGGSFSVYGLKGWKNLEDLFSVAVYNTEENPNVLQKNREKLPLGISFSTSEVIGAGDLLTPMERYSLLPDYLVLDNAGTEGEGTSISGKESAGTNSSEEESSGTNSSELGSMVEVPCKMLVQDQSSLVIVPDAESEPTGSAQNSLERETGEAATSELLPMGEYLLEISGAHISTMDSLYIDGIEREAYPGYETQYFLLQNCSGKKRTERIKLTLVSNELTPEQLEEEFELGSLQTATCRLWYYPEESYRSAITKRQEMSTSSFAVEGDAVRGNTCGEEDTWILFSIPYSEGWSALVDGQKREIVSADYGLMALFVEAGNHRVELIYESPWKKMGYALGLFGALILIVSIFWERKKTYDNK